MYMASQRPVPGDEYEEDYSDADMDTWGQAWDTLREVFTLRLKPKLAAKVRIRNGRLGSEDERFWPRYGPRNLVLEVKSPDPHVLLQKVTVAPQSGWLVGHTGRLQWSVFNLRLTGGYNVRTRRFGFGYMHVIDLQRACCLHDKSACCAHVSSKTAGQSPQRWSFDTKWRNPARKALRKLMMGRHPKVGLGKHLEFRSHSTLKCSFPEGGRPFGEEGDEVADVDMGTANFKLNKLSAAVIL